MAAFEHERTRDIGPGEWAISMPVGDWNTSVYVAVEKTGIRIDHILFPWSEIDEARKKAEKA